MITENLLKYLDSSGLLSQYIPGFESRHAQKQMLCAIAKAYENDLISLIEAGTGTGKTIAYLLPAIEWAIKKKEKTVISTNTINLQEQLLHKDIPLLFKALNVNLSATLVKGMSNYLCLRKVLDAEQDPHLIPEHEQKAFEKICGWAKKTCDGTKSSLPFQVSASVWEKACAEWDTCNNYKCSEFESCFFFNSRKKAQEAHLIVVNHHILLADLLCRKETGNYEETYILPPYKRLMIDEAHHFEDVATKLLTEQCSRITLMRTLARLSSETKGKKSGSIPKLEKILISYADCTAIYNDLMLEFPSMRQTLLEAIRNTFDSLAEFFSFYTKNDKENKLRLKPNMIQQKLWKEEVVPAVQKLINALNKYFQSILSIEAKIVSLKNEDLNAKTQGLRHEICALAERLSVYAKTLEKALEETIPEDDVRWIEAKKVNTLLDVGFYHTKLDISKSLSDILFAKIPTIILSSATLSTNQEFTFIRNRLGITEDLLPSRHVEEHLFSSPFDFKNQSILFIPNDLPSPSSLDFTEKASKTILKAIEASLGGTFVLFTSFSMLEKCFAILEKPLTEHRYTLLKQGQTSRRLLLQSFCSSRKAVLFGTDSFWEGVDVIGKNLRNVILVKLPFKVPSEPLTEAKTEWIDKSGGNSFMDYALPSAIVKFKQGFGRLIRHKNDRGCVVCFDKRLLTKPYGKKFLNSLPPCQIQSCSSDEMKLMMKKFYTTKRK